LRRYRYHPSPIDTTAVKVNLSHSSELGAAVEMLARNSHEVWAAERMDQGWRYGKKRDDASQFHPLLIPWKMLTEKDKSCVGETGSACGAAPVAIM